MILKTTPKFKRMDAIGEYIRECPYCHDVLIFESISLIQDFFYGDQLQIYSFQ